MTEYEKLLMDIKARGLDYEECDEGMIIKMPDFVVITAYWDWSNLLTNIFMSHDVFNQMMADMKNNLNPNKLSPPVFAMTYGYGVVDDISPYGGGDCTAFPFVQCGPLISDEYFQDLMEFDANKVNHVGDPHQTVIVYEIKCGVEPYFYNCGCFTDYFKAKAALMAKVANDPWVEGANPCFKYRINVLHESKNMNELW